MDNIKLDLPSNPKYLQMLRLTTTSLANNVGFDIESIEDIKVIVSEIFTYLITDNDRIKVEFNLNEDNLNVNFEKKIEEEEEGLNNINFELKKQILLSLADELNIEEENISFKIYK